MVRRFSWCTVVALVVLLFVTTDGLREHSTQIDDHKATNRGTLRFNSKSLEEATTVSSSPLSRSKTKWDRSAQSETLSNFERTIQASVINSEPKFDTSEHSTVRTIRTTERGSVLTATDVTSESRRTSGKKFEETKRVEPTINRRDGKRYFSESNKGTKLKNDEQKSETPKGISRRTSNGRANNSTVTERLDNKGPSVFLATTESSRSRTGRKIQTTYSMKDLKTQIPTSRRYNSKKFRDVETTTASFRRESRGRSTTEKIERSTRSGRSKVNNAENNSIARRGPDPLLSESESVRVDIPLTVDETGNPASDVTTGFDVASQRRSDAKESSRSSRTGFERSKSRGRSNDSEASGSSRSASPRGSSKFSDSTTTEANEQIVSSRRNTVSRDRFRGSEIKKNSVNESRSRSRGRNVENNTKPISGGASERNVKRKVAGERNSSDRRPRIPDVTPRAIDSRRQDTQDVRGRSRSKSRSDVTTPIIMDVTTTVAPDTTVFTDVTATDSEITSTTIRSATTPSPRATSRPLSTSASTLEASGRGRGRGRGGSHGRKQKEDFFNHGLGFRGRKPSPEGSANVTESRKTVSWKNDSQSHGNPGWTLRRRPAHFNSENISKTIVSSPRDQTNEVVPSNEQSTSTEAITTIESSTFGTKRGLKKLQTTDESSTVVETTTKSYRRGNKTFGNGKVIAALEESDNYPPEFKARLTQLKNTNTKIPASKTTSRTPLEEQERNIYGRRSRNNSMAFEPDDLETAASANVLTDETLVVNPLTLINGTGLRRVKKSSAALFAERSRMKLELARRLVKPELNIEENDLDATTASSFSKRKPTGVPVVDETSKVAKYSKPAAAAPGRNRPSTSVESTQEEVSVKTLKLPSSRKAHDDSSKVTGRPYSLKKGRVIAERMVTSISIEERAIAEETTRPYALTTNPSMITSAEQGSATTIDSTRVRLASDRGGKKSKEEDSTPTKNMKVSLYSTQRVETIDPVTTIKPKKSYSYQSRHKLREQSATIDQSFTTSTPKKSYSSTQSKSQTSQEENITKKSKFATSATKPIFRPRYSKRTNEKSFEKKTTDEQATFTTKLPVATSRYSKKKSSVKSIDDKSATTEGLSAQTRKIEFRPRTATYRRHSEIPTTLTESSTKVDGVGIAITPRSTKYHATLKTSTVSPRSVAQGPQVNLKIANETAQETPGITGSSNGDSGNSNVFNPTRSTFLSGNSTLLEQLRSTVAPLLSSLGNKTPVFSGSYSNVNNVNSPPRVTPSGQPPRFSARYKGAELFVRKQNNIYQPTVPSITSSSTTPITPVENSGSAPPIDVSSPGEPRFLTLYQALESASIRNEQLQGNAIAQLQKQQAGSVSQDTTSATAQATAGSGIRQTTEITTPTIPDTSIVSSTSSEFPTSSYPDVPLITTTSSSVETTTTTITTETATSTSTGRIPDGGTSTPQTTRMDVVTVTPVTETTTVNIEENLVSTEVGTSTTAASSESTTTMSGGTTNDSTNTTSASAEATTVSMQATPGTTVPTATSLPPRPASQSSTTPYLGRFGGSRLTPAPRFSLSSTTRAPLRDYLVYGIYPNKTIVRKRPEDNLIDARNVDSPYVIFGIFPDGRLVRKYPNGTIIPDPPRNPVEVVFSLSTSTTTNRPPPRPYYNQANQGTYNQYRGPVYNSNDRPVAEPMRNVQSPSIVDLGLTGNAIVGPNGGGPDNTGPLGTPASVPSINEMSNALLNTQMRTASVTPIVSTGRPPTDSQGGRIVQDRERDEATRTKEAGGQRSSVYIGQDKFVNYWTDGASTSNPRVLSVNINSVATAANEGPSPSVPSFENLLNNQAGGQVTAPPGFPWRDPLDQIFGITTSSPIITASVTSNRLDDLSEPNGPALARPINPFVEVFTPFSNTIGVPRGNIGSIPPPPPPTTPVALTTTPTTPAPTTTTTTITTMAPTTTTTTTTVAPTTTTTMAPTTTTTTMAPTTTSTTMAPTTTTIRAPTVTTTTTTSITMTPTTVAAMTPTTTTMTAPIITSEPPTIVQRVMIASQAGATSETTTSSQINSLNLSKNLLNTRQQNAFGTTFDDLAFLNSLLQSNSRSTSQKTLTQVEQLLANKILELALKNPGPTRSPKAISIENASPNSIYKSATTSLSEPIIIDLSPASTVSTSTRKSVETQQPTSQRPVVSSLTPVQVTWKPVTTTSTRRSVEISTASPSTTAKTTLISTTKAPVTVKAKLVTTPRPRTTTQAPLGFGGLLWQALLGGGLFGSSTTPKPVKAKPVPKTTQKSINIMPKPIQTTQKLETTTISSSTTLKNVDISKIQVNSPYSIVQEKSVTTPFTISTTDQPLINNPNPRLPGVVTSTYSPEEDAKFIVELLRAVEQDNKTGSKKVPGLTQDDQSFLRAILSGRALTTTTPSPTVEVSNAALLAALLKAQGIEPPTPANNIREQLQLASLGQSVTSAPTASPASESSTITTRPASTAATRPTDTTKKTVTPRPTSGPRIRTTTWSPSSTYPPPLFSSFSNYGTPAQSAGDNSGNSALFGATRAFSQFLGAAISGAAQQLQSLVRNGTRIVSEVVG
ncbi:mucin-5AC-like isoform X2 [Bombus bifarius]|uniref:Mucin-5AC-like isoform X2 n=1 Tax=Bombus bifarius TaxID=103933 RepID=A0A6P8MPX4_9HYME|nr:mucin-5AC-like isoform X2 [Bombus bifarius]